VIDDRELALIAAFRLHEVASRLSVLSRVSRSPRLKDVLQTLSEQLAEHERSLSSLAQAMPVEDRRGERDRRRASGSHS
jgi:hypothetical protein